jgi:transcriptional regulator of acetoin/glycerol metabolism
VSSTVGWRDVEAALGARLTPVSDRDLSRTDFEQRRLIAVMDSVEWSVARAAEVLAVHQATVYRRLRRCGLTPRIVRSDQGVSRAMAPVEDGGARTTS